MTESERKLFPGRGGSWAGLGLLQLLPLLLGEQRSSNFPADVVTIITRRGDLEPLLQKGLLGVGVERGVRRFNGSDIGRGEQPGNRMGEEIALHTGFAVWVSDEVVANVCPTGLIGVRCRVDSEKTDNPSFILEEIERGRWFSICFLDIEEVASGDCLLDCAFKVGAVDPERFQRGKSGAFLGQLTSRNKT